MQVRPRGHPSTRLMQGVPTSKADGLPLTHLVPRVEESVTEMSEPGAESLRVLHLQHAATRSAQVPSSDVTISRRTKPAPSRHSQINTTMASWIVPDGFSMAFRYSIWYVNWKLKLHSYEGKCHIRILLRCNCGIKFGTDF